MNTLKPIFVLFLLLYSQYGKADEFQWVKPTPKLLQIIRDQEQKPEFPNKLKALNSQKAMMKENGGIGGLGGGVDDPGTSNIYKELAQLLVGNFQKIGQDEAEGILAFNRQFNLGEQNFSGFTWQKPMGKFSVSANRTVKPYLFSTSVWIVDDTFTVYIDAVTFFKTAIQEQLIEPMTDKQIGAAAGISFKRVYRYSHFAKSYNEGLFSDFSKLFMSWNIFSLDPILNLSPYEIVSKEDGITASVGGMITSPPMYGFSGSAGVLVTYNHIGKTQVHKIGPDDKHAPGEYIRVDSTKSNAVTVAATAQIQLDLLKMIKVILFSADFEYKYEKAQTVNLSFYERDLPKLRSNTEEAAEFRHLISIGTPDIKALKPNIVSLDQREKETMEAKFALLLWGSLKKSETEQVKIVKDGKSKQFFRSHFENLKTAQNFFSRLFSTIAYAFVKFDLGSKLDASESRQVDVEYEYEGDNNHDDVYVDSEEKFSVNLQKRYEARATAGAGKSKYKKHALSVIKDYTALADKVYELVDNEELRGPMNIYTSVKIQEEGLRYFNSQSADDIFKALANLCGSGRTIMWSVPQQRAKALKRIQTGPDACVKRIGLDYQVYRDDLDHYHDINMKKFKNFMIKVHKETDRMRDLHFLFGEKNLFFHGYFSSKTKDGNNFNTFFQDGVFRGLGVIDSYIRDNRSPASIAAE